MSYKTSNPNRWKRLENSDHQILYKPINIINKHNKIQTLNTQLVDKPKCTESNPSNLAHDIQTIKPNFLNEAATNCKLFPNDMLKFNYLNNYNQKRLQLHQKHTHQKNTTIINNNNYLNNGNKKKSKRIQQGCSGKEVMGLAWYFASATGNVLGSIGKQIGKDIVNTIFNPDPSYNNIRSYYYYQDHPDYYRQPQHLITQRIDYDELLERSNAPMMANMNNFPNLPIMGNMNDIPNMTTLAGLLGANGSLGQANNLDNLGDISKLAGPNGISGLFDQSGITNRTGPPDFY